MKLHWVGVMGVAYIALMVGCALAAVDQVYAGGVYTYRCPVGMLIAMGVPFLCGYSAGTESKK